jgi:hypothetical protein
LAEEERGEGERGEGERGKGKREGKGEGKIGGQSNRPS